MNERETDDFHSQFVIARFGVLGGSGAGEEERVEGVLATAKQSMLAVEAARLTSCKAISLFGNTVPICGFALTPDQSHQLSHAK